MAETVRIFPASSRTGDSEYNNWLSEYNLSSIINQLIGSSQNGFVISDRFTAGQPFEFNIQGYYFKVLDASQLITAAKESATDATHLIAGCNYVKFTKETDGYYASIQIGGVAPYYILKDWTAVKAKDESPVNYSLKLLTTAKTVPDSSRIQFSKLKTISGQNLTVKLNGNAIESYSFTATGNSIRGVSTNCKIEVQDGKINSLVIDDGELA